jgi:phosphatidylserine/phosphatidylglycerophosphate/cardiolipin synthase-like enzyme
LQIADWGSKTTKPVLAAGRVRIEECGILNPHFAVKGQTVNIWRGGLVLALGALAVLALLAVLNPRELAQATPSAPGDQIIISEVLYDPSGADDSLEWVELYNPTSGTIDLSGYSLGNGGPISYTYGKHQLSGLLPPFSCWVIGGPTSTVANYHPVFNQVLRFNPNLRNSGSVADGLALFNIKAISITTQSIPLDAVVYGSANTNQLIDETGAVNPPDVGDAPQSQSIERGDITGTWRIQAAPSPNNCSVITTTVEPPPPLTLPGSVLISAVHYDGYAAGDSDEGFRLTNVSTRLLTLTNWVVLYSASAIHLTGTLAPDQAIWLTKQAAAFEQQFGFKPHYEYELNSDPAVPELLVTGSVPTLGPNAELTLREGADNWIDAVVWGTGQITDTGWITGWTGSNVQRYSNTSIAAAGQIIYRKLDEATGKIVMDTNTAQDWANDRADPIAGRRTQYPGWDLERFWQTVKVTQTAALTVAIAPDNAFRVIADLLGSAQQSIVMEVHTFDNLGLLEVLTKTIGRGVSVTILLEGDPVGGVDDQELWVCQHLEAAGGQCWFMINDTGQRIYDRYDFLHAKMIVVDERVVAIGSENLSPRSLTYDDFADGTVGHRGVFLATDASSAVSRALEIWNADFDPGHHRDIMRWSPTLTGTYGPPPIGFTPNYSIEADGYRILFPQPLVVHGALPLELLTAPESALRAGDSLLELINRAGAGDTIAGEQLDEPPYWGASISNPIADPNIRLEALIAAASRGAKVRLLLDRYFDDPATATSNSATVQYVEALRAVSPTLRANLEARLGDPALFGLHNKMFLFDVDGRKFVHAGSLNGTETSNKANREAALQVESSAAYAYLLSMFEYDWAFQPRVLLPLVMRDHIAPPDHLLIGKVFYLGSTTPVTGSEWVQLYNPTGVTVTLSNYKLGDQAQAGATGFTVDGMWRFPPAAIITPGAVINVATTALGFFDKYGRYPDYVFFGAGAQMIPYITYTSNISFSLANTGDEVLLLGPSDQLIDGVAWGTGALPGHVACLAIDPNQYPFSPSIKREPSWKDTNDCNADFVIDTLAQP